MEENINLSKNFSNQPKRLLRVEEVSSLLGIKPNILRAWEQMFPEVKTLKAKGGHRLYRSEDIDILSKICQLINEKKYTIPEVRNELSLLQQNAIEEYLNNAELISEVIVEELNEEQNDEPDNSVTLELNPIESLTQVEKLELEAKLLNAKQKLEEVLNDLKQVKIERIEL
jgi:DNA-binding transcriptional MerR regulator